MFNRTLMLGVQLKLFQYAFFSYLKSWILFLNLGFILDFTFEFYVVENYMGFFFELFLLIVDKCSFDRY